VEDTKGPQRYEGDGSDNEGVCTEETHCRYTEAGAIETILGKKKSGTSEEGGGWTAYLTFNLSEEGAIDERNVFFVWDGREKDSEKSDKHMKRA